jgi:hypothetical protein
MGFRIVPRSTKKLELGDGDYIEVKAGLSKNDFRKVLERLPENFSSDSEFNPIQADEFTVGVFDALVVGWSAIDEDGNPLPATVENYLTRLDRSSAAAVDTVLFEHFNGLDLTKEERTKSAKTGK